MQATKATIRRTRPLWVRIAAIVCLVACVAGTRGLLPGFVAALGALDAQHRLVIVKRGENVAVVFHHDRGAQASRHVHAPLARVLTALAQPDNATKDHILAFGQTTNEASIAAAAAVPPLAFVDAPVVRQILVSVPVPRVLQAPLCAPRPPPSFFALVCLRSTMLLI